MVVTPCTSQPLSVEHRTIFNNQVSGFVQKVNILPWYYSRLLVSVGDPWIIKSTEVGPERTSWMWPQVASDPVLKAKRDLPISQKASRLQSVVTSGRIQEVLSGPPTTGSAPADKEGPLWFWWSPQTNVNTILIAEGYCVGTTTIASALLGLASPASSGVVKVSVTRDIEDFCSFPAPWWNLIGNKENVKWLIGHHVW